MDLGEIVKRNGVRITSLAFYVMTILGPTPMLYSDDQAHGGNGGITQDNYLVAERQDNQEPSENYDSLDDVLEDEGEDYIDRLREMDFSPTQIENLHYNDAGLDFIEELYAVEDQQDDRLLEQEDIVRLSRLEKDDDKIFRYIEQLKDRFDGFTISRYCQMDLSIDEIGSFENTIKPNMIYIVPRADHNGAFENDKSLELYHRLKQDYDTYTVIASEEDDIYEALDKVPDISLIMLSGHGSMTTLRLGKNEFFDEKIDEFYDNGQDDNPEKDLDIRQWSEEDYDRVDEALIDVRDSELQEHTQNLRDNTVIFLNSCLNGKGGRTLPNLANYIMDYMTENFPESVVYSSTRSFKAHDINIRDTFPLDIQIVQYIGENPFGMFQSPFANTTYSNKEEDYENTDTKMLIIPYNDESE